MKRGMPAGVCPEQWILSHPDVLIGLQKEYVEAGSNIIYAPTFTANRIKLKEYGLEEQIKEKEAVRILRHLKEDAYIFTLEINGESPDSVSFARQIEGLGVRGVSHIQFVIGGSLGLHKSVSKAADKAVSFSDMTFPHQLMRVILLEQIYRGYRIISGEPYHK